MIEQTPWFNRKFPPIEDNGLLPVIIERLEGTPPRMEWKLQQYNPLLLSQVIDGKWSVKQQAGHLLDLEPLWLGRVYDILDGKEEMRAADLQNTRTHQADHNEKEVRSLTDAFREERNKLVTTLRNLEEPDLRRSALHPRLHTPMRIIDLAFFVAEHDDHHICHITSLYSKLSSIGSFAS